MTEPVAWRTKDKSRLFGWRYNTTKLTDKYAEPLYISEQLQPRVKMTKEQLSAFINWWSVEKGLDPIIMIDRAINQGDYPDEFDSLFDGEVGNENLLSVANIWGKFKIDNPEETIEIVPEKKWFVVRKLPNTGGNMLKCSEDGLLMYNAVKEAATQFDTKEEAEKWLNPLTEAVQLPVESE